MKRLLVLTVLVCCGCDHAPLPNPSPLAHRVTVAVSPNPVLVGTPAVLRVRVADANDVILSGVRVEVTSTGALSATSGVTDALGVAEFALGVAIPGSVSVSATAAGEDASRSFTVVAPFDLVVMTDERLTSSRLVTVQARSSALPLVRPEWVSVSCGGASPRTTPAREDINYPTVATYVCGYPQAIGSMVITATAKSGWSTTIALQ